MKTNNSATLPMPVARRREINLVSPIKQTVHRWMKLYTQILSSQVEQELTITQALQLTNFAFSILGAMMCCAVWYIAIPGVTWFIASGWSVVKMSKDIESKSHE